MSLQSQRLEEVIAATAEMAFVRVEGEHRPAAELLSLCAFIGPEDIPRALILDGSRHLPAPLRRRLGQPDGLSESVGVLRTYSLIRVAGDGLFVHRLVQRMARERLDPAGRRVWATAAGRMALDAFPQRPEDVHVWSTCSRVLPHAEVAARHLGELEEDPDTQVLLLVAMGRFLRSLGRFEEAAQKLTAAVAAAIAAHGRGHPMRATPLIWQAALLFDQGLYAAARRTAEESLAMHRQATGDDSREVGDDLAILGRIRTKLGDLEVGRADLEKAATIHERIEGPDDVDVADDLMLLAEALMLSGDVPGALGELERARAIYEATYGHDDVETQGVQIVIDLVKEAGSAKREPWERYLAKLEATYGPRHYLVGSTLGSLAGNLARLGDLAGARDQLLRALDLHRSAYRGAHPEVAADLVSLFEVESGLGETDNSLQRFREAIREVSAFDRDDRAAAFRIAQVDDKLASVARLSNGLAITEQALAILEEAFGPTDPLLVGGLAAMAKARAAAGNIAWALEHLDRAIAIVEETPGASQRETAALLKAKAEVYERGSLLEKALEARQRALAMDRRSLGARHAEIANDLVGLFVLLTRAGEGKRAEVCLEEAIGIYSDVFGPDHVILSEAYGAMADVRRAMNELPEAVADYRRALSIQEATFGHEDPALLKNLIAAAQVAAALGEWESAEGWLERALEIQRARFGDKHPALGSTLLQLSGVLMERRDFARATDVLEQAAGAQPVAQAAEEAGEGEPLVGLPEIIEARATLGDRLLREGLGEAAREHFQAGLSLASGTPDLTDDALMHLRLAGLAAWSDQRGEVQDHLRTALQFLRSDGTRGPLWRLLVTSADVVAVLDSSEVFEEQLRQLIDGEGMEMEAFRGNLAAAMPEGWFGKESMTLLAPDGQANVIFSSEPLSTEFDTHRYAEAQGELLRKDFPGYREFSYGPATMFGGRSGYVRHFEWKPPDGVPVTQIQVYFADRGRGYTATATTPSSRFPTVEPALRKILSELAIEG